MTVSYLLPNQWEDILLGFQVSNAAAFCVNTVVFLQKSTNGSVIPVQMTYLVLCQGFIP